MLHAERQAEMTWEGNLMQWKGRIRFGSAVADPQLAITWSVTIDEDIASGIIRAAEDSTDVVAMTTHGSQGLPRWVIGSITGRVLHATRLPLLIVRPPDMMDKAHQT